MPRAPSTPEHKEISGFGAGHFLTQTWIRPQIGFQPAVFAEKHSLPMNRTADSAAVVGESCGRRPVASRFSRAPDVGIGRRRPSRVFAIRRVVAAKPPVLRFAPAAPQLPPRAANVRLAPDKSWPPHSDERSKNAANSRFAALTVRSIALAGFWRGPEIPFRRPFGVRHVRRLAQSKIGRL